MSAIVNTGTSASMGTNASVNVSAKVSMGTGMSLPHKFQHMPRASLLFSLALHAVGLMSISPLSLRPPTANLPSPMVISLHAATTQSRTATIAPRATASPTPTVMSSRDSFAPAKTVEEEINENRSDDDFSQPPTPFTIHETHTGAEDKQPIQETAARPDYDYNPPPDYPLILREQGISGVVWLRVWVDSEGQPTEVKLTKGSGYRLLDDSALRAVRKWRFIPAKLGRQKLASWVEFPIRFTLTS